MDIFFSFLTFAALIVFIIGMVKPSIVVFWGQKKTRGQACLYLAAMVVFFILSGVTTTPASKSAEADIASSPSVSTSDTNVAEEPVSSTVELKPFSAEFSSGNYTSGVDFPAGTYTITAVKGGGNVSTTNMYDGGLNAVMGVKKDDMYEKEYKNIKIPEGEILTISNVTVKISSKENVDTSNLNQRENTATKEHTFSSGNYTAGEDFEAGIYDIIATKGNGNVSSDNMYEGGLNAVMGVGNDEMYQKQYKNINLGQDVVLTISGVTVKLVPSK